MTFNRDNHWATKEFWLLEHALHTFQKTTGLSARIVAGESTTGNGCKADARIEILVNEQPHLYWVEIKQVDRFAAIGHVKNQLEQYGQHGLLVAQRITDKTAEKCRELNVQFIDGQGNAYLHGPNWFVWVKGQRVLTSHESDIDSLESPRAGTATALRIIFALLCHPELLNAPYRKIKQVAGVALGAIGWVFHDLNKRGLTVSGKKNTRRILERQRVIDEWVINYPIKLRPKLNAKHFHAENADWWKRLDVARYGAQWGGEVAAEKLTGHLKPSTVTLYMRPEQMRQNLTKLVVENKLRSSPNGEIEVLETFWNFESDDRTDVVPPLLVYADLLATMDPRNFEVGRMLLEQNINAS